MTHSEIISIVGALIMASLVIYTVLRINNSTPKSLQK